MIHRRAFEVYLNGQQLCVAGIGDDGVLNTMIDHVMGDGHNEVRLRVGGMISSEQFVTWISRGIRTGDEVRVRIVEAASIDKPRKRQRCDPAQRGTRS